MAIKKAGESDVLTAVETPAAANTDAAQEAGHAAADAASRNFEQTVAALKEGVATATAQIEKTQAEVKANMEKFMKTAEDLVAFGQGNVEAVLKSGQVWAAGVQDLGKQVAASTQEQLDATVSTWKALTGARSVKEAFDLQASLARNSVEKALANTGKLTDASFRLAEQTLAPLTARLSLAAEKFGRTA